MLKNYAQKLAISSILLLAGCGVNGEKVLYGTEATYAAMTKAIEAYAVDCSAKPLEDECHANVDKAAAVLEEVHPILVETRAYSTEIARNLHEVNIKNALAKLAPIAKEMGYVENN